MNGLGQYNPVAQFQCFSYPVVQSHVSSRAIRRKYARTVPLCQAFRVANLKVIDNYAAHGETEDLQAAGKILADDLYPGLWEMGVAMSQARETTRRRWKEEEAAREAAEIAEAEKAFMSDAKRRAIPAAVAEAMIEFEDGKLDSSYYSYGDWRRKTISRDQVSASIREHGTGFVNWNPESSCMLGIILEGRLHYVYADYDLREQYLASLNPPVDES